MSLALTPLTTPNRELLRHFNFYLFATDCNVALHYIVVVLSRLLSFIRFVPFAIIFISAYQWPVSRLLFHSQLQATLVKCERQDMQLKLVGS